MVEQRKRGGCDERGLHWARENRLGPHATLELERDRETRRLRDVATKSTLLYSLSLTLLTTQTFSIDFLQPRKYFINSIEQSNKSKKKLFIFNTQRHSHSESKAKRDILRISQIFTKEKMSELGVVQPASRRNTFHISSLQTKLSSFVVRRRRNSTIMNSMDSKLSSSTSSIVSQMSFTCIPNMLNGKPDVNSVPFDQILRDATFLIEFRHFLKSECSQENLDFWLAVESYRAMKTKNKCKRLLEGKKIYRKYLAPGSVFEINVDIFHAKMIAAELNLTEITPEIFDCAQKEIYLLIKRDSYPRYKQSCVSKSGSNWLTAAKIKHETKNKKVVQWCVLEKTHFSFKCDILLFLFVYTFFLSLDCN